MGRRESVRDSAPNLAELLGSWELALRAERKSTETVKSYTIGVRLLLTWCAETGRPAVLDRPTVAGFVNHLLESGAEASTARSRHLALRRFSAWLVEEEELPRDELLSLKPPKLDAKVVPVLTDDQLSALLKACRGKDMRDRRDEAIIRLMLETGARAGEVVAMELADVDLAAGAATVRRGKGGKGRRVPIGPQTCRAIDRYLRLRKTHRLAATAALWLGDRGKRFSYDGLHKTLKMRAAAAGIEGFHPHVLRHTAASRWLAAGGSEGGADVRCRMVPPGHDRPLHQSHLRDARGRRGAQAQPGGAIAAAGRRAGVPARAARPSPRP